MISPKLGFLLGIAIAAVVCGAFVVLVRKWSVENRQQPPSRLSWQSGTAIGVGVTSIFLTGGPTENAAPRSLLAWIAVGLTVLAPIFLLALLGERWLKKRLGVHGYERFVERGFPTKESRLQVPFVVFALLLIAVCLVAVDLAVDHVGV